MQGAKEDRNEQTVRAAGLLERSGEGGEPDKKEEGVWGVEGQGLRSDSGEKSGFRSGFVSIVGKPNVGKSTLLNSLLKQKVSIVTPKAQTTRRRIVGILHRNDAQLIFVDTPGLLKPAYRLHHKMMDQVRQALSGSDVVLLMVEPSDVPESWSVPPFSQYVAVIRNQCLPVVVFLNKVDLLDEGEARARLNVWTVWHRAQFAQCGGEVLKGSALTGEGLDQLVEALLRYLPEGPPYYPSDQVTDLPLRLFVQEIIREKIFLLYRQEVPYASEVEVESFEERGDRLVVSAVIYVERPSQKKILIGQGGEAIRRVHRWACQELEQLLGKSVSLTLHVKVREKWRRKEGVLRALGY